MTWLGSIGVRSEICQKHYNCTRVNLKSNLKSNQCDLNPRMNRVDEVAERRAVCPSRQRVRRWEQNWDPSLVGRNFDPVEYGFLGWGRITGTTPESSDNVPDDLLLAWPGLVVSVLDGFDNDKMCACGPVLALFCEGLIVDGCEGAESPPLGDTMVQFGIMTSEPESISSKRGSSTLRGTVRM